MIKTSAFVKPGSAEDPSIFATNEQALGGILNDVAMSPATTKAVKDTINSESLGINLASLGAAASGHGHTPAEIGASPTGHNHDHNALTNYVANRHRLVTVTTSNPSGGSDSDVWLKY